MFFKRSKRGSVIAEGAAALVLISGLITGGILLLTGAGSVFYYKTKLAHAAEAGARYGTETGEWLGAPRPNYTDATLRSDVTSVVNATLTQMGLPQATKIDVTRATVSGKRYLRVKVSVANLRILSGGILPSQVSLDDTAASAFSDAQPPGVMGLTVGQSPNGRGFYIPIYGPGGGFASNLPRTFPKGPVHYYAVGVQSAYSNSALDPVVLGSGKNGG